MGIVDRLKDKAKLYKALLEPTMSKKYKKGVITEEEWVNDVAYCFYDAMLTYWARTMVGLSYIHKHYRDETSYQRIIETAKKASHALNDGKEPDYWDIEDIYGHTIGQDEWVKKHLADRNFIAGATCVSAFAALMSLQETIKGYSLETILPLVQDPRRREKCKNRYLKEFEKQNPGWDPLVDEYSYFAHEKTLDSFKFPFNKQFDLYAEWCKCYKRSFDASAKDDIHRLMHCMYNSHELSCFSDDGFMTNPEGKIVEPYFMYTEFYDVHEPLRKRQDLWPAVEYASMQEHATTEEQIREMMGTLKEDNSERDKIAASKKRPDIKEFTAKLMDPEHIKESHSKYFNTKKKYMDTGLYIPESFGNMSSHS